MPTDSIISLRLIRSRVRASLSDPAVSAAEDELASFAGRVRSSGSENRSKARVLGVMVMGFRMSNVETELLVGPSCGCSDFDDLLLLPQALQTRTLHIHACLHVVVRNGCNSYQRDLLDTS